MKETLRARRADARDPAKAPAAQRLARLDGVLPRSVRRATTGAPFGSAKRGVHLCLECSWCFALLSIHSVVHLVVLYAVSSAFRIFVYLRLVLGERSGQGKEGKGGKTAHRTRPGTTAV